MDLNIDKDWFAKKAAQEGDLEIGAGMRKTLTVDLTSEEIALLERLIDPAKSDMRARIAALETATRECLGWIRHWQADVAGNLKPTPDSLAMMEAKLVAILEPRS